MEILISDTSCLIDLRKALLLNAFIKLPYDLVIPDVLFETELLRFTQDEKQLIEKNFKILSISGESVLRVRDININNPTLTLNDCFAFVLAEQTPNCILLTGDRRLRELANISKIEVHGILWIIDEIYKVNSVTVQQLYEALLLFKVDPTVRLPSQELNRWIKRYQGLINS